MATDSTELTFVRCPSCRSLVPAMSKMCRMCGATLDAAAVKGEEDDSAQKRANGRVRQRTTSSQGQPELAEAMKRVRDDFAEDGGGTIITGGGGIAGVVQAASGASSSTPIESEEDPLSAYLEEVDESPVASVASPEAPIGVGTAEESVHDKGTNGHAPNAGAGTASDAVRFEEPRTVASVSHADERAGGYEDSAQRTKVFVESGQRKPGKGPGLSFAKPRVEEPRSERPMQSQPSHQQGSSHHSQQSRPPHGSSHEQRGGGREHDRRSHDNNRRGGNQERHEHNRQQQHERAGQQSRDSRAGAQLAEGVRRAENPRGRLFGWLVSYRDPDGQAVELREGKFFVSRSSLKDTDLILDNDTISTPHALVAVGVEGKLKVQDLMSEHGVAVRRKSEPTFLRTLETIELNHGDWISFGEVEFLVSLVAHVGEE